MDYERIYVELGEICKDFKYDFEYFQSLGGSAEDPYYTNRIRVLEGTLEIVYRLRQLEK